MRRRDALKLIAMSDIAERMVASNGQALREIQRESERLHECIVGVTEKEIKARNRVDITLEEYEFLKHEIESLRTENAMLRGYFSKFEFPVDLKIIPDSIMTAYSHDYMRSLIHWQIKFDVEGR